VIILELQKKKKTPKKISSMIDQKNAKEDTKKKIENCSLFLKL